MSEVSSDQLERTGPCLLQCQSGFLPSGTPPTRRTELRYHKGARERGENRQPFCVSQPRAYIHTFQLG